MEHWGWYPQILAAAKTWGLTPKQMLKQNFWEFLTYVMYEKQHNEASK
jgi:hypothetical protein